MTTEQERQERFDKVMERDAKYDRIFKWLIYLPLLPSASLLIAGLALHNLAMALVGVGTFVSCWIVALVINALSITFLGKEMKLLEKEITHLIRREEP